GVTLVAYGSESSSTHVSPTSAPEPTTAADPTSAPEPTTAAAPTSVPASSEAVNSVQSEIADFTLEDLTISVGTTVTWVNLDTAPHTATAGVSPDRSDEWDSGSLGRGKEFSFTFNKAGTTSYFCTIHPFMTATVTVVASGSSAGTSTPVPAAVAATAMTAPPTPTALAVTPTPVQAESTALAATQTPVPPETTQTPEPTAISSEILNFTLEDLTITAGTTITWVNGDGAPHTTTAGVSPTLSGEWDSGTMSQGAQFSFTFHETGTYSYFCVIHPSMKTATITVVEPSSQAANPASNNDDY
ncbi:MAG: hypothetical protein IIB15_06365, partial [Chloroflexi bacterium]|nr:hypothetical protein [Chloroflexota bacterium]